MSEAGFLGVASAMIVNVLQLVLRDDVTDAGRDVVLAALRRTASLDSVSFSTVGTDFADESNGDRVSAVAEAKAAMYPDWAARIAAIFGN